MNFTDGKRLNKSIDRISDLPDPILGLILGYLPTKYAVATSILSTRWKTLFPSFVPITKLDFDDSLKLFQDPRNIYPWRFSIFIEFVDKWLFHETACNVNTIILNLEKDYGDAKILSWLHSILRPSLRSLRLLTHSRISRDVFHKLNGCSTLVDLDLGLRGKLVHLGLSNGFVLPNLKKLSLRRLWIHPSFSSYRKSQITLLVDGCPVLEELSFCGCSFLPSRFLIQSKSLKKLCIDDCVEYESEAVIEAPNLDVFVHRGYEVASYIFEDPKSLSALCILSGQMSELRMYYHNLANLVCACPHVIRLYLCPSSIAALHRRSSTIPTFENLACLALGHVRPEGWLVLANLLLRMPNLELLLIEEGFEERRGYSSFESSLPCLPVCLETRFKKINVWGFSGSEDEIKLIEYFLKHGKVLEEVIIHSHSPMDLRISNRLFGSPRHLKTCQIRLIKEDHLTICCHGNWF